MARYDKGATNHPKIIEVVMQRLHRAGLKPKLEKVETVDSQPADPSVGIFSGYEVINYPIVITQQKEIEVLDNQQADGKRVPLSDFYSGRRANTLMGAFAALASHPDISVYMEAKSSKIILHVSMTKDIQNDDSELNKLGREEKIMQRKQDAEDMRKEQMMDDDLED